jgi:hypothetical protein
MAIPFPAKPVERRAIWKPLAIAMRPMKTATTSVIPRMARSVDFQRTRRLRKL